MNQEKKLHGITRSQFFRDAVREHMGQAGGVASVRNWLQFFDKEFEAESALNLADDREVVAGAAAEPTKAETDTLSFVCGAGELPELIQWIHKESNFADIEYCGVRIKAFMTQLNAAWFDGKMNKEQRECVAVLLALFARRIMGSVGLALAEGASTYHGRSAITHLAYIMATIYHETAATMRPIEEYGKGKGHPYGETDPQTGVAYYGRGYVQLTWRENYANAEQWLADVDGKISEPVSLVWHPELALDPFYAMQIIILGMEHGWFTGKRLDNYLTGEITDYTNARRVVNGVDRASLIAGYAKEAEVAIRHAMGEPIERDQVKSGVRGTDVRELQLMLKLTPDGIAGQKTVAAIKEFQADVGLAVDGICGPDTWNELDIWTYGIYPPAKQAAAAHNPYPHTCALKNNGPDQV